MVLAKLTKDVTLQMVSAYDFLERGYGGGRFSDLGGQGGGVLAAQGAWAADALGAEQARVGAVGALVGAWVALSAEPRVVSGVLGDFLRT
jgi:hypothetical protein